MFDPLVVYKHVHIGTDVGAKCQNHSTSKHIFCVPPRAFLRSGDLSEHCPWQSEELQDQLMQVNELLKEVLKQYRFKFPIATPGGGPSQ